MQASSNRQLVSFASLQAFNTMHLPEHPHQGGMRGASCQHSLPLALCYMFHLQAGWHKSVSTARLTLSLVGMRGRFCR